jgi:hypothetical protein
MIIIFLLSDESHTGTKDYEYTKHIPLHIGDVLPSHQSSQKLDKSLT